VARPAYEDLTARARIRDAALTLFAERGLDSATIRDIAKAAGVSSGLVRHHFGSKEGLRDACDTYALERLKSLKEEVVLEGHLGDAGFLSAIHPTVLSLYRYLVRSLLDGSPAATAMFDDLVSFTEQWITHFIPGITSDIRAFSAVLVAMQIGMLGMHEPLSRSLGADILSRDGNLRLMRALVEIHSTTLMTPEQTSQMTTMLDQLQPGQSTMDARIDEPSEGATR
jgi:TetR/AcrR family transcriptional regulator, regulator of cefoperazone and chloramphenicol sensitivity